MFKVVLFNKATSTLLKYLFEGSRVECIKYMIGNQKTLEDRWTELSLVGPDGKIKTSII